MATRSARSTSAASTKTSEQKASAGPLSIPSTETSEQRQLRYMEQILDGDRAYLDKLMAFYMNNLVAGTHIGTRTAFLICVGIEDTMEIEDWITSLLISLLKSPRQLLKQMKATINGQTRIKRKSTHRTGKPYINFSKMMQKMLILLFRMEHIET